MDIVENPKKFPYLGVLVIILIIAVLGLIFLLVKKKDPVVIPPIVEQPSENSWADIKEAAMISEKADEDYYTLDLSYPDSVPEVKNYVDKSKGEFMGLIPETKADAEYQGLGNGMQYNLTIKTRSVRSPKTISYIVEHYIYAGGAHGITDIVTFTYDASGKYISLDDIAGSKNSLNTLSELGREYFYAKLEESTSRDAIDNGTMPIPENWNRWYLNKDGIVFIFGQYSIGPYVLGIQEFPISFSKAGQFLNIQ